MSHGCLAVSLLVIYSYMHFITVRPGMQASLLAVLSGREICDRRLPCGGFLALGLRGFTRTHANRKFGTRALGYARASNGLAGQGKGFGIARDSCELMQQLKKL
ncbi:uncharacterized protein V1518DRAFT_419877 [Limtongia smithiae]|uniref:uncharacterized protein n=1 Tax=Limtongia smithiae TaxID=1125753 RepID=UPI0034CF8770